MKNISQALVNPEFVNLPISEFSHYLISDNGFLLGKNGKPLKTSLHRDGYRQVILYSKSRTIRKNFYIHRLVALSFLIPTPDKTEVNHKDGNKNNNSVTNLEWVSRKENMSHARNMGLIKIKKGDDHHSTKLTAIDKEYIKLKKKFGEMTERDLAKMFNVSQACINLIRK